MIERDSRTGSILHGTRLPVLGLNRTIEGRTRRRPRPTTGQARRLLAVHRGRRALVADEARISASRLRKPWSQTTRPRPIRPGGHQAADPQVRAAMTIVGKKLDQRARGLLHAVELDRLPQLALHGADHRLDLARAGYRS